jgi:hypothetical protein
VWENKLINKNTVQSERCFPLLHGILSIWWIDDKLNDPVAPIMSETKYITAGIAFGTEDPSAFNWSNNSIPAGISLYHV